MSKKSICFAGLSKGEEAEITALFRQANAEAGEAWGLAPEAEAAVVVIDMDSMYGQMSLMKALGAGKAVVALTGSGRADTDFRLGRPVTAEGMRALVADLDAAAAAAPVAPDPEPAPSGPVAAPVPAPQPVPAPAPADAAAPAAVGPPPAAPGPAPAAPEPRLFDYLRPGALAGPVRLQLPDAPDLVLDPGRQQYFAGAALKPLLPYCTAVLPPSAMAALSPSELEGLGGAQPWARLAWLCALASGNGALLAGFGPNDKYKLLKWPQTEREFPKHFRIATVMMKGPALLTDVAEQSGASLAEVIDFVNASLVSGVASPESAAAAEVDAHKGGGLLVRFRR